MAQRTTAPVRVPTLPGQCKATFWGRTKQLSSPFDILITDKHYLLTVFKLNISGHLGAYQGDSGIRTQNNAITDG